MCHSGARSKTNLMNGFSGAVGAGLNPCLSEFRHLLLGKLWSATGVILALRARSRKNLTTSSRASRPKGLRSPKRSEKHVQIVQTIRLCSGLFGSPGRKVPGTHFQTCFGELCLKGPNDSCSRPKGCPNFSLEMQGNSVLNFGALNIL